MGTYNWHARHWGYIEVIYMNATIFLGAIHCVLTKFIAVMQLCVAGAPENLVSMMNMCMAAFVAVMTTQMPHSMFVESSENGPQFVFT